MEGTFFYLLSFAGRLTSKHSVALKLFTSPEGVHLRFVALNPPLFMAGTSTTNAHLSAKFRGYKNFFYLEISET